jgi:plastocyanin
VPITLSRSFGSRTADAGQVEPAARPGPGGGAVAAEVGMTNQLTFTPDTVRIRVGQTVRWTNSSDVLHTVTADPSRAAEASNASLPEGATPFDSGNIQPGSTFQYTFSVAGTYQYFCIPHELAGMVGWVIVMDSDPDGDNGPDA